MTRDLRHFDTAGVPETDDPDAWLAHADVLTAAGDPRGAAIRAEFPDRAGTPEAMAPDGPDAAYRAVERWLGLDGLHADGSWRLVWRRGFIEEASFRLAAGTGPERGGLVERLVAGLPRTAAGDPADPEQWEGALIDALLSHPAAARLRSLDLCLTDYDRSAEHAARSLAARPRPRLERLSFGYDFRHLYEHGKGSTGRLINPLDHHDSGLVRTSPWDALPALRTLELSGAFLFHDVAHDGLTRLKVRGPVISDGSVFGLGELPALTHLEVEVGPDIFGGYCPPEQLDELGADLLPGLRSLDLGRTALDAGGHELLDTLANSSVLPALDRLVLGDLMFDLEDFEEGPDSALAALAPGFAHLDLRVGRVEIDGGGDRERALFRSWFGLDGARAGEGTEAGTEAGGSGDTG
jgi:hypothetical protein